MAIGECKKARNSCLERVGTLAQVITDDLVHKQRHEVSRAYMGRESRGRDLPQNSLLTTKSPNHLLKAC